MAAQHVANSNQSSSSAIWASDHGCRSTPELKMAWLSIREQKPKFEKADLFANEGQQILDLRTG
jgi:hypothetical protein